MIERNILLSVVCSILDHPYVHMTKVYSKQPEPPFPKTLCSLTPAVETGRLGFWGWLDKIMLEFCLCF